MASPTFREAKVGLVQSVEKIGSLEPLLLAIGEGSQSPEGLAYLATLLKVYVSNSVLISKVN